jgi:hypothetical protein
MLHHEGYDFPGREFVQMKGCPSLPSIVKTHPASQVAPAGDIEAYMVGRTGPPKWSVSMKKQALDPSVDKKSHLPLALAYAKCGIIIFAYSHLPC